MLGREYVLLRLYKELTGGLAGSGTRLGPVFCSPLSMHVLSTKFDDD